MPQDENPAKRSALNGMGHMRDHLFVSHSNPEDNEVALWLSLRLAALGYCVWCDLTRLLGGEDFWQDIEVAIRNNTAKFLFVLSRSSNSKPGPLQELQVASTVMRTSILSDFIVPILVDDLPHSETNIQLSRINAIDFSNWASGLRQLLEKLELDGVPKHPLANANAVSEWWLEHRFLPSVISSPEVYLTNWHRATRTPESIYIHTIKKSDIGRLSVPSPLPYPAIQHGQYLITFASAPELAAALSPVVSIVESAQLPTQQMLDGGELPILRRRSDAQNLFVRLLDSAWLSNVRSMKLPTYELSDGLPFFYFPLGFSEGERVRFLGVDNRLTYRVLVGVRTRRSASTELPTKAYWHFGLRAKPLLSPFVGFALRPHVVFSDDGRTPWPSKARLHTARRTWCKDWWNADWRDRILASVEWLSQGQDSIELQVASDRTLAIAKAPLELTSPVSYLDPEPSLIDDLESTEEHLEDDVDRYEEPVESDE